MKYTPVGADIAKHLIQITSLMNTLVKWLTGSCVAKIF